MTALIGSGSAPPVAVEVIRNDRVESVHRAHITVVDVDGNVTQGAGSPDVMVYPRSCLKPLFATTMVAAGFDPPEEHHVALAAASHSGEDFHVAAVEKLLAAYGLDASALANTPDWPYGEDPRVAWIAAGNTKDRRTANCSGKHSAMLATCVTNDWPTAGYLDSAHPLVATLAKGLSEQTGFHVSDPGVDGCGAAVWQLPLSALATGYARLANGTEESPARRVAEAMTTHPEYVGGTKREVTDIMRLLPGVVAKDGADGVYVCGLPDGRGVAVKVEDGSTRALPAAIAGALAALGFDHETLEPVEHFDKVRGGGKPVGVMNPVVRLEPVSPSH